MLWIFARGNLLFSGAVLTGNHQRVFAGGRVAANESVLLTVRRKTNRTIDASG